MLRHTGGKGEQPPCPPSSRAGERAAHLLGCLTWPFAGVDLVLNSLAEEKLQASVRCLAQHGRFLEIGKFDLSNNHPLGEACSPGWAVGGGLWVVGSGRGGGHELRVPPGMAIFLKNVTFHGILLDALWEDADASWQEVAELLRAGIRDGVVQPLKRTVFAKADVEHAFRYMAQGKHIGKVLVQVRQRPAPSTQLRQRVASERLRLGLRCTRRTRGLRCSGHSPPRWPPSPRPSARPTRATSSQGAWVALALSWPSGW